MLAIYRVMNEVVPVLVVFSLYMIVADFFSFLSEPEQSGQSVAHAGALQRRGCRRRRCAVRLSRARCGASSDGHGGFAGRGRPAAHCSRSVRSMAPRAGLAGGRRSVPRCGRAGRRAAATGGPATMLAVRGARARGRAGPRAGFGAWVAELVRTLGCACACVRPWAACVCGMRVHRRAHALHARGCAHARRACGRVCRVLVRCVCAQVRPVPLGASGRPMPASRAVQPGCCKSLGRGFPEVLPKTALCAGYLPPGKSKFLCGGGALRAKDMRRSSLRGQEFAYWPRPPLRPAFVGL